jgi:haloalkane dehalogenase
MSGRNGRTDIRQPSGIGRREVMAATAGALLAAVLGRRAWGQSRVAVPNGDAEEVARYQRERKYAQTRYGRIAYIDRGRGPAVLLLHGFPLNGYQWRGVIPRLRAQRRCLAPDFMGLGYTEVAPGQSVSPGAQADMIAEFLDTLGVSQVDIIANDSGGAVAQLFVAKYGARARTLLLTNCDVETDSPPAALLPIIDLAREGLYTKRYLRPWLADEESLRSSEAFGRLCYMDPRHPSDAAIGQYLGPLLSSPEREALTNRFAAGLAPNPLAGITESLRSCRVPTRIVWGMNDRIFSPENIGYLVAVLPQVTGIRRIPQAKLFFPEELPDVVAEEALTLWREQA